ncbi:hypothetical protein FJT64_006384 [Amphibalanus amphitrite]|uniref:Uncharacterized protein n=1 Tax=Amphibalanus amphitrite TaxID=1232801 RepID=A0A6A4W2X1_AMPAM|nr:hypothetical protein FJT64_006384 [Amphibalanus amphitrite]
MSFSPGPPGYVNRASDWDRPQERVLHLRLDESSSLTFSITVPNPPRPEEDYQEYVPQCVGYGQPVPFVQPGMDPGPWVMPQTGVPPMQSGYYPSPGWTYNTYNYNYNYWGRPAFA